MVLCKKCDRFTSFCGRSDSSEPRCEVHINSGLPEDSTDYRCQVAGCASITFMFDPELKAYVCSSHCQLTPSQFLNLNVDFQSSCNLPFSAITSGGTGSSDVSSDSSFCEPSCEEYSESSDDDSLLVTPSANVTTWNRILDGNPSHGLSDNLGRKRKKRNSQTSGSGKRKVSRSNKTDPKRVKVKARLEDYPNEPFQDVLGIKSCSIILFIIFHRAFVVQLL